MNKIKVKKIVIEHLKDLNIQKHDNLIVHSDISKFGVYNSELPKIIIDSILKIIGRNGTLAIPLYNTELDKKKIINIKKDYGKKENSILSIFFFKKYKLKRTSSIFHSHLIKGKLESIFDNRTVYESFGKRSDFDLFFKYNFKLLLLGCDARQGCTYLHHIEDASNPAYRIKKQFYLKIKVGFKSFKQKIIYGIRKKNVLLNFNKIFFSNKVNEITKSANLKFGKSYFVNIREFDSICRKLIKKDPKILLS